MCTLLPHSEEERDIPLGCAHRTAFVRILEAPLSISFPMGKTNRSKMNSRQEISGWEVNPHEARPAIARIDNCDDVPSQLDKTVYPLPTQHRISIPREVCHGL